MKFTYNYLLIWSMNINNNRRKMSGKKNKQKDYIYYLLLPRLY